MDNRAVDGILARIGGESADVKEWQAWPKFLPCEGCTSLPHKLDADPQSETTNSRCFSRKHLRDYAGRRVVCGGQQVWGGGES